MSTLPEAIQHANTPTDAEGEAILQSLSDGSEHDDEDLTSHVRVKGIYAGMKNKTSKNRATKPKYKFFSSD